MIEPSLPPTRRSLRRSPARARTAAAAGALLVAAAMAIPSGVMAEIVVHDAWMGAVPPTSKVGAVYLDIENSGDATVSIGGASSPSAPRIELHQSVHSDGRVRMEAHEAVELAAGERRDFSATGHHYMLHFDGQPVPAPGDRIPLRIRVNGTAAIDVSAEVRRPGEGGGHEDPGHDHSAHAPAQHDHDGH